MNEQTTNVVRISKIADPLGNACRCTREPHESWEGHRGEVVTRAEESA